ncbi:MAG: hypothetical protein RIE53_07925 [Rhodothermales bacterium]
MAVWVLASCDAVVHEPPDLPVIEAYVVANQPLPEVSVRSVQSLTTPRSEGTTGREDANVVLHLNNVPHAYTLLGDGRYGPVDHPVPVVRPGDRFTLQVTLQDRTILANGTVPPALSISAWTVTPSTDAIPAILVDTLAIGLDSLDLGLDAARGYVYPVQVDVAWDVLDGGWWMEAQLVPDDAFSSSILDFFLLPNAVFPEDPTVRSVWKGVYAVPVPEENSPFPPHALMVALVRGDRAFASWAEIRANTRSRAGEGNVPGAIGFVGGIALDSIRIQLP